MVRRPLLALALALASVGVSAGATVTVAAAPAGTSALPLLVFSGHLDASQVVGEASASKATADATVTLDRTDPLAVTLTTDLTWSGLTGPTDRAHLHSGPKGQGTDDIFVHDVLDYEDPGNAAKLVPCVFQDADCFRARGSIHEVLDVTNGYTTCDTVQCIVDTAVPNGFYLDMHTGLYNGGEIRGQLTVVKRKPDGRVRTGTNGSFAGDDVYNATARRQQATASGHPGATLSYQVSIQNDGKHVPDAFRVTAAGASPAGFTVRYLEGSTDVTADVVAGTYRTVAVKPGRSTTLTVRIKIDSGAGPGSSVARTLTIVSEADPGKVDAIKVIGKRS